MTFTARFDESSSEMAGSRSSCSISVAFTVTTAYKESPCVSTALFFSPIAGTFTEFAKLFFGLPGTSLSTAGTGGYVFAKPALPKASRRAVSWSSTLTNIVLLTLVAPPISCGDPRLGPAAGPARLLDSSLGCIFSDLAAEGKNYGSTGKGLRAAPLMET